MTTISSKEPESKPKPLPMFRRDLQMFPGPDEPDGSPTHNLFDPVRGQFFRVSWTESLIFQLLRPGMTMPDLIKAIESHSTLKVTPEELTLFFQEAMTSNLLAIHRTSETVGTEAEKLKIGWFKWLIYHYLYIRVPLVNPDEFLNRTLHYVRPLYSPIAFTIYGLIIVLGLILLVNRFDEFLHTFTYFFNIQGLILYPMAITCVKVIHELAHAYTAKRYKIYVPAIGIAFIVFWPVLYTDVTDSWKLAKRPQRLAISFAGVAAELIVAGLCTLGWVLSPPGTLQSLFFIVCSVTWISTLVVNFNPAMRFDGYYMMCDLWGIDNLQPRAFAMTRWQLRKWLLGIDVPPPEENFSTKRIVGMMVYSIYTWVYRLILYTAIAIFVYKQFTKALGIFLFFLEIGIFMIWPICSEIYQLYRLRAVMTINKRSIITTTILTIFLAWLILPWPHRESFTAIIAPIEQEIVYVPVDATIESLNVTRDDEVVAGQLLAQLSSNLVLINIADTEVDKEVTQLEILIASQSEEERPKIAEKEADKEALEAKLSGLVNLRNSLTLVATIKGRVFEWDESLAVGQSVSKDQILGRIANFDRLKVIAYVPEVYIEDIQEGQDINFQVKSTFERVRGHVTKIVPARHTELKYPQLASVNKGDIPVIQDPKSNKLVVIESYYMVLAELEKSDVPLKLEETGYLEIRGPWRSYFMTFWRYIHSIFWQEGTI